MIQAAKKRADIEPGTVAAAGYLRMSTNQQEQSPARQKADIESLAKRLNCKIVAWYEDHGLTGTESKNRADFQRLMADAPTAPFKAVLISEQSRLSREDTLQGMMHLRDLGKHGIKVATARRGWIDLDDMGGLITAVVDQFTAHDESIKIAERATGGKRLKAEAGERMGPPVFALDREITDESGRVVRRVHFRERFAKPKRWKSRLVASADVAAVDGLRFAFQAIKAGKGAAEILREFDRRGLTTVNGLRFDLSAMTRLLRNPLYCGIVVTGKYANGKFARVAPDGPITREGRHEALISWQLFQDVQAILDARARPNAKPISGGHLLTSVVRCGHCGQVMFGSMCRVPGRKTTKRYGCNPRPQFGEMCEVRPTYDGELLERFVLRMIEQYVLDAPTIRQVAGTIDQRKKAKSSSDRKSILEGQIAALQEKLDRTAENLALAESAADFAALSKVRDKWRSEVEVLTRELQQLAIGQETRPAAIEEIRLLLPKLSGELSDADRVRLQVAIKAMVREVRIWRRYVDSGVPGYSRCGSLLGEIEFHDGVSNGPSVVRFTDLEIENAPRIWRKLAAYIREQGRPVRLMELVKAFPEYSHYTVFRKPLLAAIAEGSIINVGRRKGWVANPSYDPFSAVLSANTPRKAERSR